MNAKHILFRSEAREKVLRGASLISDAVRVTLGPKSKCVLIDKKWGKPLVCNDGVTIAKEFELEDAEENLGAQMIRQAAERTGEAVGDGTSTATVLAHALYNDGIRNVASGASAIDIKRGLDRGFQIAVNALRELSRPVKSKLEKEQVATISAHNDASIGKLVAEAIEKVGSDGVVSVEEAKGTETTIEMVEGMQFDRGYLSPYFITDPQKMEAVLERPLVLLYEQRVNSIKDFLPLLEQVVKTGSPLLVISEDMEGEALATMVINRLRSTLHAAAVKAPGFGDRRKEMLQDMAILLNGQLISEELGVKLENITLEQLGKCQKAILTKETTTLIGGGGSKAAIEGRKNELRKQIKESKSDYDREKLQERLAKISEGVAVVHVGAASESELKSRKEAFDDAISATKAAIQEGIVPGGGLAYLKLIPAIAEAETETEGDERTGLRILKRALEAPARQLAENSGVDAGVVVDKMRNGSGNFGFDAAQGKYVDLVRSGIIDPTKVVRVALENAVSVAGVLLLTEATLTEAPEKNKEEPHLPTGEGY
jgi:chaperonin GroEL